MRKNEELEPLLNIAQVAKVTGQARNTIWRKYKADVSPAYEKNPFPQPSYIGNRRVWRQSDVFAWLEREMARPASERRGARNLAASGGHRKIETRVSP